MLRRFVRRIFSTCVAGHSKETVPDYIRDGEGRIVYPAVRVLLCARCLKEKSRPLADLKHPLRKVSNA